MASSYAWGAYYEEPFERAEEYIETQYKAFTTDASQLPLIRTAALGSLAFGVKSYGEVVAGGSGLALYYYWSSGPDGLDGAISMMAGIQMARGSYRTAAFPTIVEVYDTIQTLRNKGAMAAMNAKSLVRLGLFFTGYWLSLNKVV